MKKSRLGVGVASRDESHGKVVGRMSVGVSNMGLGLGAKSCPKSRDKVRVGSWVGSLSWVSRSGLGLDLRVDVGCQYRIPSRKLGSDLESRVRLRNLGPISSRESRSSLKSGPRSVPGLEVKVRPRVGSRGLVSSQELGSGFGLESRVRVRFWVEC
ncbi:hypothetical protein FXO38_16622 [Capsicum annuum]|nr:hypothetical protein FXO38_16622 [Capsicum annuum]